MSVIQRIVQNQVRWARIFDDRLPEQFRADGNSDFSNRLIPAVLRPGLVVYDVGGGKQPAISVATKDEMGLRVIGLDISSDELGSAPAGSYDEIIVSDVARYRGRSDGDLIICQAVLEHVRDVPSAFAAFSSILKPGGKVVLFVPSRNAVFARLNLLLPEDLKRAILFSVFPHKPGHSGFPAYYTLCTPRDFDVLAADNGFVRLEEHLYYQSGYFTFLLPLHALWRAWVLLFHALSPRQSAETFSMVLEKL